MSGKPAARQGDMTQYGGPIVQGSAGVRIGAPTGVACSVCPGGMTSGNPVNPLLGAKVQPGETDLALPGPLPFILSRTYSSYRTKTPAPVGVFGPGWKAPSDIRLSPHLYLATNSAQGPWWILGWSERVPGAEDLLPAPLPPYRVLPGMADRFGRT
ncbi:DUF6531 domain-containing protein, partial [Escherichia coli]|uniref:DUF6531 domain-containing protein n=1 Tax=Escherichia coli TaxID=562 RepID=UPI00113C7806